MSDSSLGSLPHRENLRAVTRRIYGGYPHMSKTGDNTKEYRCEPLPPLISAGDWKPANRPRMHVDKGLDFAIKSTAAQRAPTKSSEWRHRIGFVGEVAAASYFGVRANWTISEDYVGDDGYDFTYRDNRIEVKTTTNEKDMELAVPVEKVDNADYFILTQCSRPDELVHLIGFVNRPDLKTYGHRFDGKVRLGLDYLRPLEPLEMFPNQVREIQQGEL